MIKFQKILWLLVLACLIAIPNFNACSDDYSPEAGTYSGTFKYYSQEAPEPNTISGSIRFTIASNSFDALTDFEVSIGGCTELHKYLSTVIPDDRGDGWFTIFDIPVSNSEGGLTLNCDWNQTEKSNEAKCGIAIWIGGRCGGYGGSAEAYGFIVRKN